MAPSLDAEPDPHAMPKRTPPRVPVPNEHDQRGQPDQWPQVHAQKSQSRGGTRSNPGIDLDYGRVSLEATVLRED